MKIAGLETRLKEVLKDKDTVLTDLQADKNKLETIINQPRKTTETQTDVSYSDYKELEKNRDYYKAERDQAELEKRALNDKIQQLENQVRELEPTAYEKEAIDKLNIYSMIMENNPN